MTDVMPVQKFQIGQRVRRANGELPFVISFIMLRDGAFYYGDSYRTGHMSCLTLVPERPPYVPSERRVVGREPEHRFNGQFPQHYRCETDDELAARHAVERAAYDAQGDEL